MHELPTPPDAVQDPDATEVLRVWVVGESLQCSLRSDTFSDPAVWGLLLADVVRHVTEALREHEGLDPSDAARIIRAAFEADMDSPADTPERS